MKLKTLALPLICAALLGAAGCKQEKSYSFCTNIPFESFVVKDESFATELISGYAAEDGQFTDENVALFTSKSWIRAGIVDAQLIVADDFSKEGAETRYSSFIVEINEVLDAIDKAVSSTVANSDISAFNAAAAGERIEIGKTAYEVLSEAKAAFNLTEGYYNPALYYNVIAYGFGSAHDYPENANGLPKSESIAKYTSLAASFGEVTLSESEGRYYVHKPSKTVEVDGETLSMKLDLAGISKGYAVDRIEELFDKYSYNYGMFNYGSSSMLIRSNVREGNYRLGLINPRSPKRDTFVEIPVRGEKLSTSGDNEQRYFIDGVRYCHVIDPVTGAPVQRGIMSATVIGGSAAQSDALTTAIMCMGKDRAVKFIEEKLTDRKVIFTVEQ